MRSLAILPRPKKSKTASVLDRLNEAFAKKAVRDRQYLDKNLEMFSRRTANVYADEYHKQFEEFVEMTPEVKEKYPVLGISPTESATDKLNRTKAESYLDGLEVFNDPTQPPEKRIAAYDAAYGSVPKPIAIAIISEVQDPEKRANLESNYNIRTSANTEARIASQEEMRAMESIAMKSISNDKDMHSIYEKLIFDRNRNMVLKIEDFLKTKKTYFVS